MPDLLVWICLYFSSTLMYSNELLKTMFHCSLEVHNHILLFNPCYSIHAAMVLILRGYLKYDAHV